MLDFLVANIGTIIVSIFLIIVVSLIIRYLVNNKKKGKSLCGGGCSCCPMAGKCHPQSKSSMKTYVNVKDIK